MLELFESFLPGYVYCESVPASISQPLNFLSNAVFWLVAVWLWSKQDETDESTPNFQQVSAILLFLLGLTGMAWHTSGHPVALAADLFLIFLLLITIVATLCNDVLRWNTAPSFAALIIIMFLSAFMRDTAVWFLPQNAGIFLPTLFFFGYVALDVQPRSEGATVYILSGAYLFFLGLLARSLDSILCSYFPLGLHFLWHIFLAGSLVYIHKTLEAMKDVPVPEPMTQIENSAVENKDIPPADEDKESDDSGNAAIPETP